MLRLASVLLFGEVFLVAVGLSAAQAQDNLRKVATGNSSDNDEVTALRSEISELRSEVSQLRSNMKTNVSGGYEQGPSCGCDGYAAPPCGYEVGCGSPSASCCEDCCCCGFNPGCSCGWYAAGEATWIRPRWNAF